MPSTPSADRDHLGTAAADEAFAERRQAQLARPSRRRVVLGAIAAVVVLVLVGAAFGKTPDYGDVSKAAAALRKTGKADQERGGSQCVGWPSELTISAKPASVAPDRVVVYLTQQGWNFAMGADLVEAGATIELSGPEDAPAAFRASSNPPAGVQVTASDGNTASIRPTLPEGPSDAPMVTTRCTVRTVTVQVVGADGQPLGPDVLQLANGLSPGNPATFERRLED